ncbi:uncharacterized protein LOC126896881 isoform X2 [Daktulosphaira vitifoliae]|uniref:uncharacterized protein LOC126896881 isoform X2 n=1 Tax=Daktulosphaira vitifoliae TaxID=58002 RepID=UPI0021AAA7D4|nr:uncharacterized protein LOC126896881 isoform X2 [Daktulosphaira vitifoliae]
MTFRFIKNSVLLSFLCYIKLNNSHEVIKVPHKCFMIDGDIKLHHKKINSPVYYNPVDTIWKIEKCHSLGFTYKEVNTKVMFTSFVLPVELYYTEKSLPIILSELICGDRLLRKRFARNIVNNLISNDDIKQLFKTEKMYNEYIAKYVTLNTTAQPIYNSEVCPICFDKISISCVLNNCKHQLCGTCTDKLLIKKRKSCPLCRASFITFLENEVFNEVMFAIILNYFKLKLVYCNKCKKNKQWYTKLNSKIFF